MPTKNLIRILQDLREYKEQEIEFFTNCVPMIKARNSIQHGAKLAFLSIAIQAIERIFEL